MNNYLPHFQGETRETRWGVIKWGWTDERRVRESRSSETFRHERVEERVAQDGERERKS